MALERAAYETPPPLAPLPVFSGGMMGMFAGAMAGGTGGAPLGPSTAPASQAPSPAASGPPRSISTAAEAPGESDCLADLAKNQRKHPRNFELGLAGSDYRTTGDFGSAGSGAVSAADGNIAAYNLMIDAIREAIRSSERLASVLEDAADDGPISAAKSREIAAAEAAAAYDATLYAARCSSAAEARFVSAILNSDALQGALAAAKENQRHYDTYPWKKIPIPRYSRSDGAHRRLAALAARAEAAVMSLHKGRPGGIGRWESIEEVKRAGMLCSIDECVAGVLPGYAAQ